MICLVCLKPLEPYESIDHLQIALQFVLDGKTPKYSVHKTCYHDNPVNLNERHFPLPNLEEIEKTVEQEQPYPYMKIFW